MAQVLAAMKKEITPNIKNYSLPYTGIKGEKIVKRLKKDIGKKINIKTQVT